MAQFFQFLSFSRTRKRVFACVDENTIAISNTDAQMPKRSTNFDFNVSSNQFENNDVFMLDISNTYDISDDFDELAHLINATTIENINDYDETYIIDNVDKKMFNDVFKYIW